MQVPGRGTFSPASSETECRVLFVYASNLAFLVPETLGIELKRLGVRAYKVCLCIRKFRAIVMEKLRTALANRVLHSRWYDGIVFHTEQHTIDWNSTVCR